MKEKGFVISAILYPLLVLFLALIMGLLAMISTRKRILDNMKLNINNYLFEEENRDYYTKSEMKRLLDQAKAEVAVPVGTIISYMGTNVPKGYLPCDGKTYTKQEYPELAEQIEKDFGRINYFGGDGTTTFAVPDLRGEFLRGTGTNGHTQQGNGAAVGGHQNGTIIPSFTVNSAGNLYIYNANSSYGAIPAYYDIEYKSATTWNTIYSKVSSYQESGNWRYAGTIRPTNTSVLYCIKYRDVTDVKANQSIEDMYNKLQELKEELTYLKSEIEGAGSDVVTPIGTIISYMGTNVPAGYLTCDGSVKNIEDYPRLAAQIKKDFGRINYFGGDGTTTFAVPDLRGEFIRGTGTNGHANSGNGTVVGGHQNATWIPNIWPTGSQHNYLVQFRPTEAGTTVANVDVFSGISTKWVNVFAGQTNTDGGNYSLISIRPTNTSVNFCIKY